jgi:fatty-acid desaturase
MITRNKLALALTISHISIPLMLIYGQWWHFMVAFGVYFMTGCFGMSMTYHRLLSHRSWRAPRWFEVFGTLCATYGLTGSSIAWPAIHRQHHRFSDKENDPHSPWHKTFMQVQFLSLLPKPSLKLVRDLIADPFHKFLHRHYFTLHALILIAFLVINPFAAVYLYLFPAVMLWHAGSAINTIGHRFGYRNFETADHSQNNPVLGIFMWGEGWHNNHHRYPARASFKVRWFEFDLSAILIGWLTPARRPLAVTTHQEGLVAGIQLRD